MYEKNEDIMRFSDLIIIILNYKKIATFTFILCMVATVFICITHIDKYSYTLDVQAPQYLDNNGKRKYIGCTAIQVASKKSYLSLLRKSPESVYKNQFKILDNSCSVTLNSLAPEKQKPEILKLYDSILSSIYSDPELQASVQNWKKVISKNAEEPINKNAKTPTDYMLKLLTRAKDEKMMLESLNERPSNVSYTLRSFKPENISKSNILIFGFLASILISFFSTFIANFICITRKELKDKKN